LKQSILIIEDEKEISDTLTYALASENYIPIWVMNGELALQALADHNIDLCILDVGLPDSSGFEVLKTIRQSNADFHDVPVIFLTARSEEIDRIIGLEIGADDYVCKPFSPREVVTRVKVILKRTTRHSDINENHSLGIQGRAVSDGVSHTTETNASDEHSLFTHKPEQRLIRYEHKALDLTRAEYELLTTFLDQPRRVFSRRQLIEHIWSSNHPSDDRAIDTHIKTLRAKLKTHNPHKEFIVTHRGFGYSLEL